MYSPNKKNKKNIFTIFLLLFSLLVFLFTYSHFNSVRPGELHVISDGLPLEVFLNNDSKNTSTLLGETPLTKLKLNSGIYSLNFKNAYFEYKDFSIIEEGSKSYYIVDSSSSESFTSSSNIWFDRKFKEDSDLVITSHPDSASVKVNDVYVGDTPLKINKNNLPPVLEGEKENYKLELNKDFYSKRDLFFSLEDYHDLNIHFKLSLSPLPDKILKLENNFHQNVFLLQGVSDTSIKYSDWIYAIENFLDKGNFIQIDNKFIENISYYIDAEGIIYDKDLLIKNKQDIRISEEDSILFLNKSIYSDFDKSLLNKLDSISNVNSSSTNTENLNSDNNFVLTHKIINTGVGWLRVRSQPNILSNELDKLIENSDISLIENFGDWSLIRYQNGTKEGYVSSVFLEAL